MYKIFLHIYLKHQETLQTTLTMESNYLLAKPALPILEAATKGVLCKKLFLEISQNSQENTCARVSFLIKMQACNFIRKETLTQAFSGEFCEISENTFFAEHVWSTASTIHSVSSLHINVMLF